MTDTTPCPWKVGDKVQRKPGASYLFPGVIISTGLKLDGKTWHCEVECIAPGVEGCTHVFPASQLVPLDPAWNTRANADARLVEALTPSGDTKAAYMGEFSFSLRRVDDYGDQYNEKVYVPWDTIKEIMKAIRDRAALSEVSHG